MWTLTQDWSFAVTGKECLELPEAARGKNGFFPRGFGASGVLVTP